MSYLFRRRRRQSADGGSSESSANAQQMLSLSLFIMLLAFFIILNAISSYEEFKTEKVRRSILMTFSNEETPEETQPSPRPDPMQSLKEGHAFDRLEALFEAQIAGFEAVQSKSTGVMMVQVPKNKLIAAIKATGQVDMTQYPDRRAMRDNFFLPTLISIIKSDLDGRPTRMEILFRSGDNPAQVQNLNPKKILSILRDNGEIARMLEEKGLPQRLLTIGIEEGEEDFVQLVFRKYTPYAPVKEDEHDAAL